jgi:hypothetical protein
LTWRSTKTIIPNLQLPKTKAAEFYAASKEMRQFQEKPVLGKCMFWCGVCETPPIGSHLLARSWLALIADKFNHIVQLQIATKNLCDQPAQVIPQMVGINNITIFPGFCEKHDNEVFACLEKSAFTASREQLITLRCRSVCREACIKHQMVACNLQRFSAEAAPISFREHVFAEMTRCIRLLAEKQSLETALTDGTNCLDSYVVRFAKLPSVLVSTTGHPLFTFTGRLLEYREEWMTLSVIPGETGGWAIFSWPKNAPKNSSLLVKSLPKVPRDLQTTGLINYIFEVSENHAVSPSWWNSLKNEHRGTLIKYFGRSFISRGAWPPAYKFHPPATALADWQPEEGSYV